MDYPSSFLTPRGENKQDIMKKVKNWNQNWRNWSDKRSKTWWFWRNRRYEQRKRKWVCINWKGYSNLFIKVNKKLKHSYDDNR